MPPNKEMKLTSVERIGRSQLISGVRRTDEDEVGLVRTPSQQGAWLRERAWGASRRLHRFARAAPPVSVRQSAFPRERSSKRSAAAIRSLGASAIAIAVTALQEQAPRHAPRPTPSRSELSSSRGTLEQSLMAWSERTPNNRLERTRSALVSCRGPRRSIGCWTDNRAETRSETR